MHRDYFETAVDLNYLTIQLDKIKFERNCRLIESCHFIRKEKETCMRLTNINITFLAAIVYVSNAIEDNYAECSICR